MQMVSQLAEQMQALRAEREAVRDATREQIRLLQDSLTSLRLTPLEIEPESKPEPLYDANRCPPYQCGRRGQLSRPLLVSRALGLNFAPG